MPLSLPRIALAGLALIAASVALASSPWPAAVSPVVRSASGFVVIPGAALPPSPKRVYRAIYDARLAASNPGELAPAIDMAASELNALGASHIPVKNADFIMVFHGESGDGYALQSY